MKEIQPSSVTIKNLQPDPSQQVHMVGINLQYGRPHALRMEKTSNHIPKPNKTSNDDWVRFIDLIGTYFDRLGSEQTRRKNPLALVFRWQHPTLEFWHIHHTRPVQCSGPVPRDPSFREKPFHRCRHSSILESAPLQRHSPARY